MLGCKDQCSNSWLKKFLVQKYFCKHFLKEHTNVYTFVCVGHRIPLPWLGLLNINLSLSHFKGIGHFHCPLSLCQHNDWESVYFKMISYCKAQTQSLTPEHSGGKVGWVQAHWQTAELPMPYWIFTSHIYRGERVLTHSQSKDNLPSKT